MTLPTRYRLSRASAEDRKRIHGIRHQVYATELGQHPENDRRWLEDELDAVNEYLVVRQQGDIVGFISVTPPRGNYSVDKYFPRREFPVPCDTGLYELRLLTVLAEHRRSSVAALLMYAALRWISSRGASHVLALGRVGATTKLYEKFGLRGTGRRVRAGAVEYELMSATLEEMRLRVAAIPQILGRLRQACAWELDFPFEEPAECYHGGASFRAIGDTFDDLNRADQVISADVLDAWFPPAPSVLETLRTHLPLLLRSSPPTYCGGFLRAVAQARGVPYDTLVPGAGSSDLIFRAFRAWLSPASRVLTLDPTYGEYTHVMERVVKCRVDRLSLRRSDGYAVDTEELGRRGADGYDVVVLVNPNSPTGRHIPEERLREMLDAIPTSTRVWIDETYVDYCGEGQTLEGYAARSRNIVVCKSMSKVYALSGARAAYLCAPPPLAQELLTITPPWVLSLPAQVAAVKALAEPEYYQARWRETHELRSELAAGLRLLPAMEEVIEGVANFLLCHLTPDAPSAEELCRLCRAQGLYLRNLGSMGSNIEGFRIAVKDRETNRRMLEVLCEVLSAA
jgi:histidinol-phosphate/aromatic aminotransferase/cobyric acid decarboxylase-like protein/N-acyl-L-homoserine lactone synthetase